MDELVKMLIGITTKLPFQFIAAHQHDGQKMLAVEFHLRENPDFIEVSVRQELSVVYDGDVKSPLLGSPMHRVGEGGQL